MLPSLPPIGFANKILFMYCSQEQEFLKLQRNAINRHVSLSHAVVSYHKTQEEESNLFTAVRNYLNKNRFSKLGFLAFLLLLYANPCSITHVWTLILKSFYPFVSLASLPNTLEAISWQELKHFISVKGGKFNFVLHTISFAILPKYSYYKHVTRLPTKHCMIM